MPDLSNISDFIKNNTRAVINTISETLGQDTDSALRSNIEKSNGIKSLIMSHGLYDRFAMGWTHKFSRFGILDPYNAMNTTREYVFITKPDLCLFKTSNQGNSEIAGGLDNYSFFADALKRYRLIAEQLQSSANVSHPPFMTVLSNALTSSLDIPGIEADTVETAANVMGTKMTYRGTSHKSDEELNFNLEFEDTKYLDVYMLFKIYDEYEKLKWNGAIDFSEAACGSNRWRNYTLNKILHDQVSMYKFVVGEDGTRLIYWARLTGCMPTTIPRDAFSDMNNNDQQKLTVGWKGHFVRDMDPIIIHQFNEIVKSYAKDKLADMEQNRLPLFNKDLHAMEGSWSSCPYISARTVTDSKHGNHTEYFLEWLK